MQPHPFLTGAILYLLDVPPRVKRENIKAAFKCCGTIKLTSLGYAPGVDSLKTRTWEVLFESMVKGADPPVSASHLCSRAFVTQPRWRWPHFRERQSLGSAFSPWSTL
jgi:hypothetical protein